MDATALDALPPPYPRADRRHHPRPPSPRSTAVCVFLLCLSSVSTPVSASLVCVRGSEFSELVCSEFRELVCVV